MKGDVMDSYGYGWQKFHQAVNTLVGRGSQEDRLAGAIGHLTVLNPPSAHLPPTMLEEFTEFLTAMTSFEALGVEGRIQATVNDMGEFQVGQAAEKILGFYDTICRHREPSDP